MRSKIVKEQLDKCSFADLSDYNPTTRTYHIPRYVKPNYVVGNGYLVRIDSALVNNPNSILATNCNNGNYPKHAYYKIYVSKSLGKMIYFDGLAFDITTNTDLTVMWSGWISVDNITLIKEL